MLLSTTSLLVLFFLIPQATGTPQETRLSVDNTTGNLQRQWCCHKYLSFPPLYFLSNIIAGNRNALMQDSSEFVIVVSALPQAQRKLKNNNNNSTSADTGVIGARSCLTDWGVGPVEWRNRNNKEQGGRRADGWQWIVTGDRKELGGIESLTSIYYLKNNFCLHEDDQQEEASMKAKQCNCLAQKVQEDWHITCRKLRREPNENQYNNL